MSSSPSRSQYKWKDDPVEHGKIVRDTRGNTIVIGISIALSAITLLLLAYAWANYRYRPIKAKSLGVVTIMYIMTIPWYMGSIISNGLVEPAPVWQLCKLWSIWFRVGGGFTFVNLLFLRAYCLHRIFNLRKPSTGWKGYLPSIILTAIMLVFCIISQILKDDITMVYRDALEQCHYVDAYRYVCAGIVWAMMIIYTVQMVKIRAIKSSFNEFRESLAIFIINFVVIAQLSVLIIFIARDPFNTSIRLATVLFEIVGGDLIIWIILAYPVYQCIFHKKKYEKQWLRKLAGDGLRKEYNIDEALPISSLSYSRMTSDSANASQSATAVQMEGLAGRISRNQRKYSSANYKPDNMGRRMDTRLFAYTQEKDDPGSRLIL